MKALIMLFASALLLSCSKGLIENDGFVSTNILDLRKTSGSSPDIWLKDFVDTIVPLKNSGGTVSDTLGHTKVISNGQVVFDWQWVVGYMSSKHVKSRVMIAYSGDTKFVFIGSEFFVSELAVISSNYGVQYFNYSTIEFKKIEVNQGLKALRIIGNSSWTRTGPLPDKVTTIYWK